MRPGSVVVVRGDQLVEQPNIPLRHYRDEAATAIRRAGLGTEESAVIWALALAAEGWDALPGWVRLRLDTNRTGVIPGQDTR